MAYTNALIESIQRDLSTSRRRNAGWGELLNSLDFGGASPQISVPQAGSSKTSSIPTSPVKLSGGVDQWISAAYKALGIPLTADALTKERWLIQKESGGNPRAQNNWDSNAKKGIPSKGLAQTIDPTFNQYRLKGFQGIQPGEGDIWDPVENLVASLQYRKSRYGNYNIGYYKGGY